MSIRFDLPGILSRDSGSSGLKFSVFLCLSCCMILLRAVVSLEFMQFTFRPSRQGTSQILGELESKVMKVVWDQCGCTAKDVLDALEPDKKHAYTTIATILQRLYQKGLVTRTRRGKAFFYKPMISQEEFTERITRDVLAGLMKEKGRPILSTFVDLLSEDQGSLKELRVLLNRKGS